MHGSSWEQGSAGPSGESCLDSPVLCRAHHFPQPCPGTAGASQLCEGSKAALHLPGFALSYHRVRFCWQSVQGLPTARWDGDKDLMLPGQAVSPTRSTTLCPGKGAVTASLLLGAALLPAPGTKISYSWSPLPSPVSHGARMASPHCSALPYHRDSLLCLHHAATAQASRHSPRTGQVTACQ